MNDKLYLRTGIKDNIITKAMLNFSFPKQLRKGFCLTQRISDYRYHNSFKQHYDKLKELHNKHLGERCFIVGMGPSLDKTRFDLIKDEHFIVSNNFYQGQERFGINPKYWCVADDAVFDIHAKQLLSLDTTLFLTDEASRLFVQNKDYYMNGVTKEPIVIKPLGDMETWMNISKNLRNGVCGGMVIYSDLQIAFHLGFKDIYLLGCDCTKSNGTHFEGADTFNTEERVIKDNEWLPTFKKYKIYKKLFEKEGRTIYNATVGGDLEVFERRSLGEAIKKKPGDWSIAIKSKGGKKK